MDRIVGVWSEAVKGKSDVESGAWPVVGWSLQLDADRHSSNEVVPCLIRPKMSCRPATGAAA